MCRSQTFEVYIYQFVRLMRKRNVSLASLSFANYKLIRVCVCTLFYAPAIRRMVERAYSVTTVRPSVSVRVRDGVKGLRLSFSGVSNLRFKFFRRGNLCPLVTFLVNSLNVNSKTYMRPYTNTIHPVFALHSVVCNISVSGQ